MDHIAEGSIQNSFYLPALIIASFSTLTILTSVALKFVFYLKEVGSIEHQTSVSTFSMILVLLPFVPLTTNSIGVFKVPLLLNTVFFYIGALLVIVSTAVNIMARITIARFWSDQIVIHEQHKVINIGVFAMVRHPMYSSLIFYNLGLSLIFMNYYIQLINLVLFIPMMIYRARKEELQILNVNKDYQRYALKTPFLIPKLWKYKIK